MSPVQLEGNMKENLGWKGTVCYRQVVHLALYFWFMSGCFNFSPWHSAHSACTVQKEHPRENGSFRRQIVAAIT